MSEILEKKALKQYFGRECNADVARLSNLFPIANAPFELAYANLHPNHETIEHNHNEDEIFICVKGNARFLLDKKNIIDLQEGEILHVEKDRYHKIINQTNEIITVIAIWWNDSPNIKYKRDSDLSGVFLEK